MKKPSRLDYAYAVGRVKALEMKLVEKAVFLEACGENDFFSAIKVIFDAGDYSEEMIQAKSSEELDEYIVKEEKSLHLLMTELLFEENVLKIFLEEYLSDKTIVFARKTGYPFLVDYMRHKIDLANLKIFCRLKYSGRPREKLESLVLKGGFIDEKMLIQSYDLSFAEVGNKIQATGYHELWTKATDALDEQETFVELERGIEDFLMGTLRKAKQVVFGPEPVFAYGLAKKRELGLVRLVGVGKLNELPPQILRARISETYV
jgi:V/A-type H+-transporting ATPase subunit C